VCGADHPWTFPAVDAGVRKSPPAFGDGEHGVLKTCRYTSLTRAAFFCDICVQAGLPKGVVKYRDSERCVARMIVQSMSNRSPYWINAVGRHIREVTGREAAGADARAGGQVALYSCLTMRIWIQPRGLVDAIWFNQGQVRCAGLAPCLVHEPVGDRSMCQAARAHAKLRS